ncbi:secreted protein [Beggiatoa sp. PS]|nr:secreted protein [Beggiatoa sp. PS]
MKRLWCWLVKHSVLIPLFWGTAAVAQTDLLDVDSYQEGDMPAYGENIIVNQDEKTGIKSISQVADAIDSGTINFPVSLSGDFELFLELDGSYYEKLFLTSDEYKIQLNWSNSGNLNTLFAGKDSDNLDQSGAEKSGINKIRFSVVNNVAKVYMNDVFDGKLTLKPDLVYSQLMMQSIGKNTRIYALQINGSATNVSPTTDGTQLCTPTESSSTSGDCMATYSLDGTVHIPCISVPDAFGGTTVYDVQMQQQSGAFTFDLDLTSVKPR